MKKNNGFIVDENGWCTDYSRGDTLKFPKGIKGIEKGAVGYDPHVTKVIVPEGCGIIGDECFSGLSNLQEIQLPKSLIHIGKKCFRACTKLKKITLPDGLATIGEDAFLMSGIESINVPNNICINISGHMFGGGFVEEIKISKATIRRLLYEGAQELFSGTKVKVLNVDGIEYDAEKFYKKYCRRQNELNATIRMFYGTPFCEHILSYMLKEYREYMDKANKEEKAVEERDAHRHIFS